jgi:hypothetical protein
MIIRGTSARSNVLEDGASSAATTPGHAGDSAAHERHAAASHEA